MKPRGALMIEHRLIEKVLAVVKKRLANWNENNFDPLFLDAVVDFITVYADRTHHGKEEDILFKTLERKELKEADFTILEEQPVYLSFWERGCKYFNITGPDGERLEFNQIL